MRVRRKERWKRTPQRKETLSVASTMTDGVGETRAGGEVDVGRRDGRRRCSCLARVRGRSQSHGPSRDGKESPFADVWSCLCRARSDYGSGSENNLNLFKNQNLAMNFRTGPFSVLHILHPPWPESQRKMQPRSGLCSLPALSFVLASSSHPVPLR